MAQYIFTMDKVGKVVPPKKQVLKDISLSFFPGAKIGVLGLNGAGKSSLLRIMAGVDPDYTGEARPQPGINIGYLPQEPELDEHKNVQQIIEESLEEVRNAQQRLEEVYAGYAEEDGRYEEQVVNAVTPRTVGESAPRLGGCLSCNAARCREFHSYCCL